MQRIALTSISVLFFLAAAVLPLLFSTVPSLAGEKQLTIAGASDLAFALKEIAADFEKETGYKVVLSMGSTGMLAKQIEHGAPFDAFFSANRGYVDGLAAKGLVLKETVEIYARGRIALATRKGSVVALREVKDLQGGSFRIAIANPEHAPQGAPQPHCPGGRRCRRIKRRASRARFHKVRQRAKGLSCDGKIRLHAPQIIWTSFHST